MLRPALGLLLALGASGCFTLRAAHTGTRVELPVEYLDARRHGRTLVLEYRAGEFTETAPMPPLVDHFGPTYSPAGARRTTRWALIDLGPWLEGGHPPAALVLDVAFVVLLAPFALLGAAR